MVTVTGIIILATALLLQQSLPAQTQSPRQCKSITLQISLQNGQSYQKSIGPLALRIDAQKDNLENDLGWRYSLVDELGRDYIYPANPPIRFTPLQMLGPGYNLSARESMDWNRELRFLLGKPDYERIDPLLKQALWPVDSPDPENAGRNYIEALEKTDTGILHLNILDAVISSDNVVTRVVLEFRLTVPASFPLDSSLAPDTAACPESMPLERLSPNPEPSSENR